MRRLVAVAVILSAVVLVVAPPAHAADAFLTTTLSGAKEINPQTGQPNNGDPDAFGFAFVLINDAANQACVVLVWFNVDGTPSGLHIHGPATTTTNAPVRVPFTTPAPGSTFTFECVTVADEALLDDIAANPQQYYLNLHSTPLYAAGAIRGQLG